MSTLMTGNVDAESDQQAGIIGATFSNADSKDAYYNRIEIQKFHYCKWVYY